MHSNLTRRPWLALALLAAMPAARADFSIPGFELVHTVPVANSLSTPDLRAPGPVWIQLFDGARQSIDIEQFYAVDHPGSVMDQVIQHLEAAGKRGVKIRFLLEDKGQKLSEASTLARLRAIPNLTFAVLPYAQLPEAPGGFIAYARVIHTKTMEIDGQVAWVGTSNWLGGYMDNSRNLEVVMRNPAMASRIGQLHAQLWDSPYAQPLDIEKQYPTPHPGTP